MATYGNYQYGSRGDEVKKLQESLNKNGYSLDTDGIFGVNTQNAVRDYQQKNGLEVNGIAGDSMLTKLYGTNNTPVSTENYTPKDPTKNGTFVSKQGKDYVSPYKKPEYANTYGQQVQDAYNAIINRGKFIYDVNSDMLYNQYKDQYTRLGNLAMQDTMGQAAALTGGYGSTYGQAVGQQQYDAYLQKLNDVIPELYNSAYNRYQQEGNDLKDQYSMLRDLENNEYNRWVDDYGRWKDDRDFRISMDQQARQQAEAEYNKLYNLIGSTGYNPTDEDLRKSGMTREVANALLNAWQMANTPSGGGGGGGGGRRNNSSSASELENSVTKMMNNGDGWSEISSFINKDFTQRYGNTSDMTLAQKNELAEFRRAAYEAFKSVK